MAPLDGIQKLGMDIIAQLGEIQEKTVETVSNASGSADEIQNNINRVQDASANLSTNGTQKLFNPANANNLVAAIGQQGPAPASQSTAVEYKTATVEPITAGTIPKLSIDDLSARMDSLQAEYNKTAEGKDYKKIADWLGKNIPKAEEIKTATAAHYDNMLTDCGNTILSKYTIAREDSIRQQYNAGLVKGQEQATSQIYTKYGDPAKDYAEQDKYTKTVTATKLSEVQLNDVNELRNVSGKTDVTNIGDINAYTALAVKLEGMGQDELRQLSAKKSSLKSQKQSTTAVDAKIKAVKEKQNAITGAKAALAKKAADLKKERQQAIDKVINVTDDIINVKITIDGKETETTIKKAVDAREKAVEGVGKDDTNTAIKAEVAKLKEGKTETFTDSILKNALIDEGAKEAIKPFIDQINTIKAEKKSADDANGSLVSAMKTKKEACEKEAKNPSSTPPSTSLDGWDKAAKAIGFISDAFAMVKSFDPAYNGGMGSMGLVDPRNFGLSLPQIPDVFKNTLGLPTGINPGIAANLSAMTKSIEGSMGLSSQYGALPSQIMGSGMLIGNKTIAGTTAPVQNKKS